MSKLKFIWAIYKIARAIIDYIDQKHGDDLKKAIDKGVINGDHVNHEKLLGNSNPGAPAIHNDGVRFEPDEKRSSVVERRSRVPRYKAKSLPVGQQQKSLGDREEIMFFSDV